MKKLVNRRKTEYEGKTSTFKYRYEGYYYLLPKRNEPNKNRKIEDITLWNYAKDVLKQKQVLW